MFEKLQSAFSNAVKSLGEKELGERDIDAALSELEIALLESDVALEVVDSIKADLRAGLLGSRVEKKSVPEFVRGELVSSITGLFGAAGTADLLGRAAEKKARGEPFLVLFVGINGTGKTTTLAKVAHLLRGAGYSVVVAAGDTFRAGAIEQLREHTNRLGVKLVAQNYNSDPAAVARDAALYARSHRTDCVLIDTAGRMQTSTNLMDQIAKITKVVGPDMKIFVGDSLAGNDTVNQAREFHEHVRFDGSILTKADADARGGAALSIVKVTSTPVMYVGVGQEYGDLRPFDLGVFLEAVFGPGAAAAGRRPGGAERLPAQEPLEGEPAAAAEPRPARAAEPAPRPAEPQPAQEPAEKAAQDPAEQLVRQAGEPRPAGAAEGPAGQPAQQEDVQGRDPFEGLDEVDIRRYSELYGEGPPENDEEAGALASRIGSWVNEGRPDPDGTPQQRADRGRKRGRFGFLRR